jgi:hypothetical protein
MADNINVTQGSGTVMATDDVGGVQYPRVKVSIGADGSATDVSSGNPLPVSAAALPLPTGAATAANQSTANTSLGNIDGKLPALSGGRVPVDIGSASVTITGPVTVSNEVEITNDSGAPIPMSAAALPLPSGAATETTLSALNTKIPAQAIAGLLPVDTLGTPGASRVQTTAGIAASVTLTSTCRRVSMFATQGAWYSISGTATSSSHYIGANERLDFDVPVSTTISVLRETTDGSIRITELV